MVPVLVPVAQGMGGEYYSGDGEGASVGNNTYHVSYSISIHSRSLARMLYVSVFSADAIREEVVNLLPVYITLTTLPY